MEPTSQIPPWPRTRARIAEKPTDHRTSQRPRPPPPGPQSPTIPRHAESGLPPLCCNLAKGPDHEGRSNCMWRLRPRLKSTPPGPANVRRKSRPWGRNWARAHRPHRVPHMATQWATAEHGRAENSSTRVAAHSVARRGVVWWHDVPKTYCPEGVADRSRDSHRPPFPFRPRFDILLSSTSPENCPRAHGPQKDAPRPGHGHEETH